MSSQRGSTKVDANGDCRGVGAVPKSQMAMRIPLEITFFFCRILTSVEVGSWPKICSGRERRRRGNDKK